MTLTPDQENLAIKLLVENQYSLRKVESYFREKNVQVGRTSLLRLTTRKNVQNINKKWIKTEDSAQTNTVDTQNENRGFNEVKANPEAGSEDSIYVKEIKKLRYENQKLTDTIAHLAFEDGDNKFPLEFNIPTIYRAKMKKYPKHHTRAAVFSVRLPFGTIFRLKDFCEKDRYTITQFVTAAIESVIDHFEAPLK